MASFNREDLISQLAAASGVVQGKYDASRFDAGTGTLYCNGRAVSGSMIQQAKEFFTSQREQYAKQQSLTGAYEMMTFFDIGIAAIEQMQNSAIADGGKVVIKDNNESI